MSVLDDIKRALFGGEEGEKEPPTTERGYAEEGHDFAHAYSRADGQSQRLGEYDGRNLKETYVAALQAQRDEKDHHFRHDPYSPLPAEALAAFEGLRYFEPDSAFQFTLTLEPSSPEPLIFQTSSGDEQHYRRLGTLRFEVGGEPTSLALYESEEGDLFLPFRDATSGKESYGAGRYLEPIPLGDGQLLVDFNLAYNPYCAYSPDFSCPLPPFENWLKVPIRAGERRYHDEPEG